MAGHTSTHDPFSRRRFLFWVIIIANLGVYALGVVGFRQYEQNLQSRIQAGSSDSAARAVVQPHHGTAGTAPAGRGEARRIEPVATGPLPWNSCYHALQLFILHTPHLEGRVPPALEFARWLAPLAFGSAAIFAFWRKLRREFRRLLLMRIHGHTIICGLGEKGLELVRCHRGLHVGLATSVTGDRPPGQATDGSAKNHQREPVIVIEQDPQNPLIETAEEAGAVVLIGSVTDEALLREARIQTATRLVAVCGDDGTNVEVATRVQNLLSRHPHKGGSQLQCAVHLTSLNLLTAFQQAHVTDTAATGCQVKYFDIYEFGARELFEVWPLFAASSGSNARDKARILILGFGRMGRAVAIKTLEMAKQSVGALEIHVFDRNAKAKQQRVSFRFGTGKNPLPIIPHEGQVDSSETIDEIKTLCADNSFRPMLFFTTDSDILNVELALRLSTELKDPETRFAVRLTSTHGLAKLFAGGLPGDPQGKRLRAFGMIRDSCCHRAYVGD